MYTPGLGCVTFFFFVFVKNGDFEAKPVVIYALRGDRGGQSALHNAPTLLKQMSSTNKPGWGGKGKKEKRGWGGGGNGGENF